MTECFFSNRYADRPELFQELSVWEEEGYRKLQGTYPVIFLSFASVKSGEPEKIKIAVKQIISNVYSSFRDMMKSEIFDGSDRKYFNAIADDMVLCPGKRLEVRRGQKGVHRTGVKEEKTAPQILRACPAVRLRQ